MQLTYNDKNELVRKYVFVCSDKGEVTGKTMLKPNGSFDNRMTYQYDDKGHITGIATFSGSGSQVSKATFCNKYDPKGNIIEKSVLSEKDSLLTRFTYKVDNNGNILAQHEYNSKGKLKRTLVMEYKFDKTGNWTSKKVKGTFGPATFIFTEREIAYY